MQKTSSGMIEDVEATKILQDQVNSYVKSLSNLIDKVNKMSALSSLKFSGIYDQLTDLTDAIPKPTPDLQAIVLNPSEKYFHVVNGKWVELAPVGDIHTGYVGVYDSLADLKIAVPSPADNALAIVGTTTKLFYIFKDSAWNELTHDDLVAINAKIVKLESEYSQILTKVDGLKAVVKVSMSGGNFTFTHRDGAKQVIKLPSSAPAFNPSKLETEITALEKQITASGVDVAAIKKQIGGLDHDLSNINSVFTYSGNTIPTYPTDKKSAYFINLTGAGTTEKTLNTPENSEQGTMLYLTNESTARKTVIRTEQGKSINSADHLDVPIKSFATLVLNGNKWVVVSSGHIPESETDLINRVAKNLHDNDELHTTSDIVTIINNWMANPHNQGVLDSIIKKLGYEKKTIPPHPVDSIQIYIGKSDSYPTAFTRANGPFATHQKLVLNGMDSTPSKIWVAVTETTANKVSGIVIDNGLPAQWDSKTVTIDGKQWMIYISPYQFHAATMAITINWSI